MTPCASNSANIKHDDLLTNMPSSINIQNLGSIYEGLLVKRVGCEIDFPFARRRVFGKFVKNVEINRRVQTVGG